MAIVRVMRIGMPKSNVVEDQIVNTLYFNTGTGTANPSSAELEEITGAIDTFWNEATSSGVPLRDFIGENTMAEQRTTYKIYNMDDPQPRPIIGAPDAQNPTPTNSVEMLPAEVAVCLSFRGNIVAGTNAARRRGRIYVGPLNIGATEFNVEDNQARPAAALKDALVLGARKMAQDLAALGTTWGVYSPTTRGLLGAAATGFFPITTIWCDNAFDTQRRRGPAPSSRVQVTV